MMTVGDLMNDMTYAPVPVDASAALTWLKSHSAAAGADILHPVNGEKIATVAVCDAAAVAVAATAARDAAKGWVAADRGAALRKLAAAVDAHAPLLATLAVLESGRTIWQGEADVAFLAQALRFYASAKTDGAPYGVVAAIAHWSAPLAALARLAVPALAAGNTVLFKPEHETPLTALCFAELAAAVLPSGVFQTIVADRTIFGALAANVDKLSAALCRKGAVALHAAAGATPLSLWRMRRAPFVVCEEADLDAAAEGAVAMLSARVMAARLLVQESVAEGFYARVAERMAHLRVGDPLDRTRDVGICRNAARLVDWQKSLLAGGATLVAAVSGDVAFAPALISGAEPAMPSVANDLFGPVLLATEFRTVKEAVALATKQDGFVPATVYSTAIDPALAVTRGIDCIGVSVNAGGTDLWLADETGFYVRGEAAGGASVVADETRADVAAAVAAVKGTGSVGVLAAAVAGHADTLTDALVASGAAKADAKKDVARATGAVQALADRFAVTNPLVTHVNPGLCGIVAPVNGPLCGALSALAVVLGLGGRAVLLVPTSALASALKSVCPAAVAVVAGASAAQNLARHRGVDTLWYDGADALVFAAAAEDLKPVITDGFTMDGAWRRGVHVKHLTIASKV